MNSPIAFSFASNVINSGQTGNSVAARNIAISGQKSSFLSSLPAVQDDAYVPGTEGKTYDRFTVYLPSGGGTINYKTGQIEPGYIAMTLVTGDKINTNSTDSAKDRQKSNILTTSEINREDPGAFLVEGKWTLVEDFLNGLTPGQPSENSRTPAEPDPPKQPQYYFELTAEQSEAIFGKNEKLQIQGLWSDDPNFNPEQCGIVDSKSSNFSF